MGATPELALEALREAAKEEAQRAGERAAQTDEALEAKVKGETEARRERAKEDELREECRRAEERRKVHGELYPKRPPGAKPVPPRRRTEKVAGDEPRPVRPPEDVPRDVGPREYWFEVVDVRLTPAPGEGGGSGWLAYGTLAWMDPPRQVTTTGSGSCSPASDPTDPGHRGDRGDRGRCSRDTR